MSREDFFSPEELKSLREITMTELKDLIAPLGGLTKQLRREETAADAAEKMRRIFHTIGGSAALAGFSAISALGHKLETLISDTAPPPEKIAEIEKLSAALISKIQVKD